MNNIESKKKIILVPHCLMSKGFSHQNRNSTEDIFKVLFDRETGIVQMPCPHLYFLTNKENTLDAELSHCFGFVKEIINKRSENIYDGIINPLLTQIEKYKQLNFEITGLIGIKGSPVCGIYNPTVKESGSFILLLNKKLRNRGICLKTAVI